jgi:hypothetical protein
VAFALPAAAQATHVSEPARRFELADVREWVSRSPLGDLKAKQMGPNDIEMRFWQGFARRTNALVLWRHTGRWSAAEVVVQRCSILVPSDVRLTEANTPGYEAQAARNCGNESTGGESGQVVVARVPRQVPLHTSADLSRLWTDLVNAGLLTLPPQGPPVQPGAASGAYVVEVRRGGDYRASVIDQLDPPATGAAGRAQHIERLLLARLHPDVWN